MILYEPTKKIAGLFHLTTPLDVSASATPLWRMVHDDILELLFAMQRNGVASEDRKTLVADLIGGQNSEDLPSLLPVAENALKRLGVSRISIEEGALGQVKHIAFDARDGKTYNLKNPLPRKENDFDKFAFQMRGDKPHATSDRRSLR